MDSYIVYLSFNVQTDIFSIPEMMEVRKIDRTFGVCEEDSLDTILPRLIGLPR